MSVATEFLRSISLGADLARPERLAHYWPTARSLRVIDAVAWGRPSAATMVIAAYGSGKSLAAGIGALLARNRPQDWGTLATVLKRLTAVDGKAAARVERRHGSARRGKVIALHGHVPDLPTALLTAAGIKESTTTVADALAVIAAGARQQRQDRVAIVWDEFGRHLEGLIADGASADLLLVQELAEWAVRQTAPRATLTLLLHQSLLNYASRLNQSARSAWRKIEGRFEILRFVEDSREVYELIGRLVENARPQAPPAAALARLSETAERALALGWFPTVGNAQALARILGAAWPLTPGAVHALPSIVARLAQNERSLFSFLDRLDLRHPIGFGDLYAHFGEAMRSDSGLGGSHRRWLETESARSRADDAIEREVLAAACLLQLGSGGDRRRLPRAALALAVAHDGQELEAVEAAIDRLIGRKLLLHRLRNDDVSIWHGADLDVRNLVEEEKARLQADFDLAGFCAREVPPPVQRPLRHNAECGVGRYCAGHYLLAADLLRQGAAHPGFMLEAGVDGRILYVLAESAAQLEALEAFTVQAMPREPGLVLVLPNRPLEASDAAFELAALLRLREDRELLASDPLILPELNELLVVAREHLHCVLLRLIDPERGGARWFANGEWLQVGDRQQPLAEVLSCLADERFPKTPRILNDQVVRHSLSRPMVNARKKVLLGILERSGEPRLGFDGMTTPDASIYRTVIERTGIYGEAPGRWRWRRPGEISDPVLAEVWSLFERFLTEPTELPKPVAPFLERLIGPPYGVRRGIVPILFGAAVRAFAEAVAIRRAGAYLTDVLPSEIEAICLDPQDFTVEVVALDEPVRDYLQGVTAAFGVGDDPFEGDLVRAAYDAIWHWRAQLPESALSTQSLDNDARAFQDAIRSLVDPVELIMRILPRIAGTGRPRPETVPRIIELRRRLESVVEGYTAEAVATIRQALHIGANGSDSTLGRVKAWADCFANGAIRSDLLDLPSRSLLNRAQAALGGHDTEASFARALSTMLLGRGFERWTDRTGAEFEEALRARVERIERAALEAECPSPSVAPLLENRLAGLVWRASK